MALLHCLGETEGLSPLARSYWAPLLYSNTVFSRVLDLRLHCVTAKHANAHRVGIWPQLHAMTPWASGGLRVFYLCSPHSELFSQFQQRVFHVPLVGFFHEFQTFIRPQSILFWSRHSHLPRLFACRDKQHRIFLFLELTTIAG